MSYTVPLPISASVTTRNRWRRQADPPRMIITDMAFQWHGLRHTIGTLWYTLYWHCGTGSQRVSAQAGALLAVAGILYDSDY